MNTEKTLLYVLAIGFIIVIVQWIAFGTLALLVVKRIHRSVGHVEKAAEQLSDQAAKMATKLAPAAVGLSIVRKLRRLLKD